MEAQTTQMDGIVNSLAEIQDDSTVPRNVRVQIQLVIATLKENNEMPIKINKAVSKLDELASDVNLQAYTRTQIWNLMSVLEKI